jgi:arylsulfatase A-like enzyme
LFWWPGTIEPDVVSDLGSTLDLLPTLATLAGASLEQDRALDGIDLTSTLYGDSSSARDEMFYYRSGELWAYRQGPFKLHFRTQGRYGLPPELEEHDPPLLYNLDDDIGERWNIAEDNGDILERMLARIEEHRESLESPEPEFDRGRGEPPVWRKN